MMINFENLTKKVKITGVVHVGAHEGGETLTYVDNGITDVILIEANPLRFEHLKESIATGRHCTWCSPLTYQYLSSQQADILKNYKVYNYAITDIEDGTVALNLSNYDGGSDSIFKINEWGTNSSWAPYEHIDEVQVPTTTLDKLIVDKSKYNFINIDVEGAELLVLKGAVELLTYVDAIMLETQTRLRFDGSCTQDELVAFLKLHNFVMDQYNDTGNQWGDALFLKVK